MYVSEGLPFLCSDLITACAVDEMRNVALAGASLVVMSTVARAMGGANENSAEDMSGLIHSMDFIRRECGATVLSVPAQATALLNRAVPAEVAPTAPPSTVSSCSEPVALRRSS